MSENITHTALLDDSLRLLRLHPATTPVVREAAVHHRDLARLGSITRHGDLFTLDLLEKFRQRRQRGHYADADQARLAFVLGWLTHRAADRQMKVVFRRIDPDSSKRPRDASVYHDAFCFREVFALGHATADYHPALFEDRLASLAGSRLAPVEALEEVVHVLVQRALIELHTLIPDPADIEGWIDRLRAAQQTFHVDRHRYARALLAPDPELWHRFIVEDNFYDREEPIIAAARAIQRDEALDPQRVAQAVGQNAASQYAQALHLSMSYLLAACDFLDGKASDEELRKRLKIGTPGSDGIAV